VCYSVLQRVSVCCSVLQYVAVLTGLATTVILIKSYTSECVAAYCSALQCCSGLQWIAGC